MIEAPTVNGAGSMNWTSEANSAPAMPAVHRADGEAQQRVGLDVDAQRLGPYRVVAQRREGLAPGRSQQAPQQRASSAVMPSTK